MPLDPDRVRDLTERAQSLSKRLDAMIERSKADADDDDEDGEDDLEELAEAARNATPGSDLANLNAENRALANPELEEPWW
jgi:hypothetical protein